MDVLLMGSVSNVSRVLFSFSEPIELITMLPTIMMIIIITMGIIMVWLLTMDDMSPGVIPVWSLPSTTVTMESPEDVSGLVRNS